ncbi:hypothetical protein FQA39_LY15184 [Lamprigera yunnana]|nr:hypothetical protein FQA39_LY15184 [Lamprigera yunnana]
MSSISDKSGPGEGKAAMKTFLQIPCTVVYDGCVTFLKQQAKELNLPVQVYYCFPNKPIVIITWEGYKTELPSIVLSSHMDVVPVFKEQWKYDPFSAHVTEQGDIYARGAQDMKSVAIQYVEAVRRLRRNAVILDRTVHLLFTPDEEIGGAEGMKAFVKTKEFRNLNVGFVLDEGLPSPNEDFEVFYGERCIWYIIIHCTGTPGHGSLLIENTAGEKVRYLLNKFYEFRTQEREKLRNNPTIHLGDVTSVNVTLIEGGVQANVIPEKFKITVDCRISNTLDIIEWESTINRWCKEAGEGVSIEYKQKQPQVPPTKIDNSNAFWVAMEKVALELNINIKPQIFSGGTNSRYVREVGIPAIGFSPINNTPVLLHDNNEYINQKTFLQGIEIFYKLILELASVEHVTG